MDCCSPCSSLPQRSQVREAVARRPRWGKYTILLTIVQPPPQVASYQVLYCDVHRFEVGRWFRERGGKDRAGANKQVLHDIACSLVKQRAEPWNRGEAAHSVSLTHSLSPPTLRLCSSPHKLPRSHPSFPLQPSRPSSGSPPGSMPACPSPLPTFPRGPSTHPPSRPLPSTSAYLESSVMPAPGWAPTPTPRLHHI